MDLTHRLQLMMRTFAFYFHEPSNSAHQGKKGFKQPSVLKTLQGRKGALLSRKQTILSDLCSHGKNFFKFFCCTHQTIFKVVHNCSGMICCVLGETATLIL